MKLEVSEQFVREAHASACKDWKTRIEEEFPSLFEVKLEVGKWYIDNSDGVYMFKRIEKDSNLVFGFFKGEWSPISQYWSWDDGYGKTRLATPQEIEFILWKEAEKRGIWKYTKIEECLFYEKSKLLNTECRYVIYDEEEDILWNMNGAIYNKGKWAKPLNENKEIKETISRLEKELKELKEKMK